MTTVPPPRRPVVFKANRDTLVLLAAATAMTLALGYSVHNHPPVESRDRAAEPPAVGEWAGELADLSPSQTTVAAPAEPLSSDALTLPKAAMALPVAPRPPAPAKPRSCDGVPCPSPAKVAAVSSTTPPARQPAPAVHPAQVREATLVERLNPLNHLPEVVTRPFAVAGDTIVGWVKRF